MLLARIEATVESLRSAKPSNAIASRRRSTALFVITHGQRNSHSNKVGLGLHMHALPRARVRQDKLEVDELELEQLERATDHLCRRRPPRPGRGIDSECRRSGRLCSLLN